MRLEAFILFVAVVAATAQTSPRFAPSSTCVSCHSAIPYPAGAIHDSEPTVPVMLRAAARSPIAPIGPHSLWKSSTMANSAVDPYWQARVRWEARQHPTAAALIEDTCMHCHAPMQRYDAHANGTLARLSQLDALGRDGVSCTLCHQIQSDRLGTKESFTAEFLINDRKQIYGPHANPFSMPMINQSGYTPVLGAHIAESAMCGSCHTVITPVLDTNGSITGEFVEQAPFLEWLASDFPAQGKSCQSCHMPPLQDSAGRGVSQFIATNPAGSFFHQTTPRQPFALHSFAGANVLLSELLSAIGIGDRNALEVAGARAKETLAGALALSFTTEREGDKLNVDVSLRNLTGHKLPTAFPSRRMWIHLRVTDAKGQTVFESGKPDFATGGILGWDGNREHRDEIDESSEVIVYEAVLADSKGMPTKSLLSAAKLWKDNRILPAGFRANAALPPGISNESIQPVGTEDDNNFVAGQDRVSYEINAPLDRGPFTVTAEVLYQTIRPDEVSGFSPQGSMEESTFLELFAQRKAPYQVARREGLVR